MKGYEAMSEGESKFHRLPLQMRDDTRESAREAALGEKISDRIRSSFFELLYHTTTIIT